MQKKMFQCAVLSAMTLMAYAADGRDKTDLAKDLPNIIIILNDDQGYQDLGCYGSPDIQTPNVDQLAREGMRFTDYYVASCVCSASRAALLTGCYPERIGVPGVFFPNRGHKGMSPDCTTIAELLKTVGYSTQAIGKWHLGDHVEFLPTNQGFDSYYGIPYSNDMYPAKEMKYAENCLFLEDMNFQRLEDAFAGKKNKGNPRVLKDKVPLMRNEECIEFPADQSTITRRYADEGIRFISESVKEGKPFFLYLANSMPHTPLFASPDFKGKSERGLYGDVIEEIDFNTGRLMAHLKELKIDDNTIVIFTSDNGPWLIKGDHGGSALPLFEGKMTRFEGGQRVPAIIKWPGKVPAGSTCSEMALSMDLLPTLAEITGASLPEHTRPDGASIIDLITDQAGAKTRHEFFFFGTNAVRSGDWKYHKKEIFKVKATKRESKGPTLYNLKNDIGESNNVINDHPEVAERLRMALDAHTSMLSKKK
jgi:arylsulfatase A